jgi:ribonuclease kappa
LQPERTLELQSDYTSQYFDASTVEGPSRKVVRLRIQSQECIAALSLQLDASREGDSSIAQSSGGNDDIIRSLLVPDIGPVLEPRNTLPRSSPTAQAHLALECQSVSFPRPRHNYRNHEARRRWHAGLVLVSSPQAPISRRASLFACDWVLFIYLYINPELGANVILCSVVISAFAMVILSVIAALFKSNHHSMMGSTEDPADGAVVASTVFGAIIVYAVRIRLYLSQAPFHSGWFNDRLEGRPARTNLTL